MLVVPPITAISLKVLPERSLPTTAPPVLVTKTLSNPDASKPETVKTRSVRFVKLSESNVPVSFAACRSGSTGVVGEVASINTFILALSVDVFPAESITK